MSRAAICHCTDWHITDEGDRLFLKPSATTAGKRLAVTLLALLLIGGIVWWCGMPPGSHRVRRANHKVATLEAEIDALEKRQRELRTTDSQFTQGWMEQTENTLAGRRSQLTRAQAAAAQTVATLGPVGDTIYWSACGLLLLVGVLAPLSGAWESVTIDFSQPGYVRVKRKGQVLRSPTFATADFQKLIIITERVILTSRGRHGRHTSDHGWRWHVRLEGASPQGGTSVIDIMPEQEPTLPVHVERLTPRVREVVAFLQRHTGLEPLPVLSVDVLNIEDTPFGTRRKVRARQHGGS